MYACINDPAFELSGATPEGGTYSGTGVSGGYFNPAVAGVGYHLITYTYVIPGTNCAGSCEFYIHVKPLPQIDCPAAFEVCLGSPKILLDNAYPQGGEYSGTGVIMDNGFYYFDPSVGVGTYKITYCFTDPETNCTNCCEFVITVVADHIIQISQGWSGISSYIVPDDPDIVNLMYPTASQLILLYHDDKFYWPVEEINTIINWNTYWGYVIKVTDNTELPICGEPTQNKTISLTQGWNLIPVLSSEDYDIQTLFDGITGFQIAKEVAGTGVYWKDYGINTIGCVEPGKAYYVRMTASGSINYALPGYCLPTKYGVPSGELKTPWNEITNTPGSHLVAFNIANNMFATGDIVGGFTPDGKCAGVVEITDTSEPFALSLNGDDATSAEIDGFETGEIISYKLYRPSTGEVFELQVSYKPDMNSSNFQNNGLSEITQVKMTATNISNPEASHPGIYPNPTHGVFNISGINKTAGIRIMNAFGEEIFNNEMTLPAKLDLTGRPNGVYLIRIEYENNVFIEKLILN